jgi:hypothetical protein
LKIEALWDFLITIQKVILFLLIEKNAERARASPFTGGAARSIF